MTYASGNAGNTYSFKEGKSATTDMNSIFKQEKGARLSAGKGVSGGAKVKGGAKSKIKKAAKSGSFLAKALMKATPGASKYSTVRIKSKAGLTPTAKGTTDGSTMKQFKEMVSKMKKK